MTVLTQPATMGDVLKYEVNPNYTREIVPLLVRIAYPIGSVLGRVALSGKYTLLPDTGSNGAEAALGVLLYAVDAMQAVPRHRGQAATARAGLRPGRLPALHRPTRGHGRMVADQPAAQANQDGGSRRASRPCCYLLVGRGCHHRCHGQGHPRRNPPITCAAVMCVTTILTETERKRQDRSAHRAEERRRRARMMQVCGLTCSHSGVLAHLSAARGTNT